MAQSICEESKLELEQLRAYFPEYSTASTKVNSAGQSPTCLISNPSTVKQYLKQFDAVLFDCDGVLYRGADATPHAGATVRWLMEQSIKVLFVTNNAGKSRLGLRDKLASLLDCEDLLQENQMVGSAYSCARYLQQSLLGDITDGTSSGERKVVHVIGSDGLCREIKKAGFIVDNVPTDLSTSMSAEEVGNISDDEHMAVDALVIGLDTSFNYRKLCMASYHLHRNPSCLFIATNEDAYDVVGSCRFQPGNGCIVKAVEHASQRKACNVGKPSKILVELVSKEHDFDPEKALMVGDRLDTDVMFGHAGRMNTCSVLTGCTTAKDLLDLKSSGNESVLPTVVIPFIGLGMEDAHV
eukprot:CAMPEP_0196813724 /NCGR_PEP_ID=MMETSP1362-20130617/38603_1 /TAXON_ID=163516 /ORGANISM="Leptocylindrus danicus, Strain CCMP1856" /LENGTH=353 /DNA_ID=CAMNT_0042190069 /DNA_START=99 /DNA_END=1160 /DNA_ORIENTATION=+